MGNKSTEEATPTGLLTVLSLSPLEEDHLSLQTIVGHSRWKLLKAYNLASARTLLAQPEVSVVLCDSNLPAGNWIDMLQYIQPMAHPPSVVVTSRLADEHLWVEALNLGAWDVISKPFDRFEVIRSVKSAWDHWDHSTRMTKKPLMAVAG